jgi:lipoprotein-anchoring transpeptidase ErfK/SrfK
MRFSHRFTGSLAGAFVLFAVAFAPQNASARGDIVNFNEGSAGTIVIKTSQRRLYYVLGGGKAIRYPVGVGRAGMQWQGSAFITSTRLKPAWSPPKEMIRENPRIPRVIPSGARNNPMGAAALTLSNGEYAIHGTNAPGTIGGFVSHGCIRMYNADIMDLYERVHIGTPVTVTR